MPGSSSAKRMRRPPGRVGRIWWTGASAMTCPTANIKALLDQTGHRTGPTCQRSRSRSGLGPAPLPVTADRRPAAGDPAPLEEVLAHSLDGGRLACDPHDGFGSDFGGGHCRREVVAVVVAGFD